MQYVLTYKTYKAIDALITKLKNDNFSIYHGLDNVMNLKDKIIGLCIDLDAKTVFQLNVTCMACWCDGYRKPLYVEEIIDEYDKLILQNDYRLYEQLVIEKSKERNRPSGMLLRIN